MSEYDLLFAATEGMNFFCNQNNHEELFVEFDDSAGVRKQLPVESKKFKRILQYKTADADDKGKGLSGKIAVELIHSFFAANGAPEAFEICTRISGNLKTGIEYALGNDKNQSVVIDENGWTVGDAQGKFISTSLAKPQVTPCNSEKSLLFLLKRFVNMARNDLLLFMVWLIQCFSKGTHFGLMLNAQCGSGKSTLSRMIKKILDPSHVEICDKPAKLEDLIVYLGNSHLVCIDNVGIISKAESDLLCGAITGTHSVKRSLFTDSDIAICSLHNVLVVNGICTIPQESDLAERFLVLELQKITGDKLLTDEELWEEFEKTLPYILGAIFDTLSRAIVIYNKMEKPQKLHRMAVAHMEMSAIAEALGVSAEEFEKLLWENVQKMNVLRGDSPVVEAVKEFMSRTGAKKKESGTSSQMYLNIRQNYSGDKNLLPRSASAFSKKINLEYNALRAAGITVSIVSGAQASMMTISRK